MLATAKALSMRSKSSCDSRDIRDTLIMMICIEISRGMKICKTLIMPLWRGEESEKAAFAAVAEWPVATPKTTATRASTNPLASDGVYKIPLFEPCINVP